MTNQRDVNAGNVKAKRCQRQGMSMQRDVKAKGCQSDGISKQGCHSQGMPKQRGIKVKGCQSKGTPKQREVSHEIFVFASSTFTSGGTSRTTASFSHLSLSLFEGHIARLLRSHIFHFHFFRDVSRDSFVLTSSTFIFRGTSPTTASVSHLPLSIFERCLAGNVFLKVSRCSCTVLQDKSRLGRCEGSSSTAGAPKTLHHSAICHKRSLIQLKAGNYQQSPKIGQLHPCNEEEREDTEWTPSVGSLKLLP